MAIGASRPLRVNAVSTLPAIGVASDAGRGAAELEQVP